jgi:hypothetical protein
MGERVFMGLSPLIAKLCNFLSLFILCSLLAHITLYYSVYYSVLLCITLYYSVLLCTTLYYSVPLCTTLYYSVMHIFFAGVTATMVLSGFGPYRCMWR